MLNNYIHFQRTIQLYDQIIHQIWEKLIIKRGISQRITATNKKIEQNKVQYNLDKQTAKISAISSGNVNEMSNMSF